MQITGDKEILRNLRRVDDAVRGRALKDATEEGAKVAIREIRKRAPVGTARKPRNKRLRNTFLYKLIKASRAVVRFGLGTRAPHAHLVEFGTSRGARPHPFFRPGLRVASRGILQAITRVLARTIRKAIR